MLIIEIMKQRLLISLLSFFLFLVTPILVLAEDKPSGGIIPKLPQTQNDPELFNGHVYPFWGPVCQRYTYSVIYRDKEGQPPEYVKIYFNGKMIDMEKQNSSNNDYKKGVKYIFKYVPKRLGSNFYFFEASNGLGKTRDSIIDSPDNGPVLFESAFDKNEIALIDKSTGKKVLTYSTDKEWVGGIALSDDGKYLAAKTSCHIYLFDRNQPQKPLWSFEYDRECTNIGGDVKGGIDISSDGGKIFAAIGNTALLFDKKSNKPKWQYNIIHNAYNVAISADGQFMAIATSGGEEDSMSNLLTWFSERSNKPLRQFHSSGNFHDVSLSNNGQFIAASTGCPDRRAYIFSKDSDEPVVRTEMLTRDSPIHRAKISADGSLAAFGAESGDGAVFLFSRSSQKPLWKFPTPGNSSVRALNFTPDGQHIGAATFGGHAYIFSKDSSKPLYSWNLPAALGALDISDDGSFLAVGGTDNQVHLLEKDQPTGTIVPFNEYIGEIDISGNGRYIAAGTAGSVYFFESIDQPRQVSTCSQIIEPEPESMMMDDGVSSRLKVSDKSLPGRLLDKIINFFKRLFGLAPDDKPNGEESRRIENPGVCGNRLCEDNLGESRDSCPQDCSAGD